MKIVIIGSTQYVEKFNTHKDEMEKLGHIVRIPAFDDHPDFDELEVCEYNLECIEWADAAHLIWDGRSIGTVFDFGMVFALRKPLQIIYVEEKTILGVMRRYIVNIADWGEK